MMPALTPSRTAGPINRRAFTVLELLVVVAIVLVLVGIVGGVGFSVLNNQKSRITQGVLTSLDRALEEYIQSNGGNVPPYRRLEYVGVPGKNVELNDSSYFLVYPTNAAQVDENRYPLRPDAAVFLRDAMGYGEVQSIVSGLGERFLRVTTTPPGSDPSPVVPDSPWDRDKDVTPSVVDAWALEDWAWPWDLAEEMPSGAPPERHTLQRVIYYVHPKNPLAQQVFGKCENGRPYFVSAGPDGYYGLFDEFHQIADTYSMTQTGTQAEFNQDVLEKAREDNLYSYPVKTEFTVDPLLPFPP